jgi:2-polyprenyl-3-methyl-5-hydroxy-6-metoxy-1,4-benzoquinol methylase
LTIIRDLAALFQAFSPASLLLARDWYSSVRLHFLHAALEAGLLEALVRPASKDELKQRLGVERPELLDALLDVGLSLGELSYQNGRYRIKGRRSRAVASREGDALAALVQANVTYYNAAYRELAGRLRGGSQSSSLDEIGALVARVSKLAEPFLRGFVQDLVEGRGAVRILDVGCGAGIHLRSAAEANAQARGIGIDMDAGVVAQALKNIEDWGLGDRFQIMVADIRRPPAGLEGPFDLMTLHNVIYYFPQNERRELFESLRAMLSPRGSIALVSSFQSRGRDVVAADLNVVTSSTAGCTPLPDLDDLTRTLEESGYTAIERKRLVPRSAIYGLVGRAE